MNEKQRERLSSELLSTPTKSNKRKGDRCQPVPATRRIVPFAISASVSTTNSFSPCLDAGLQIVEGVAPKHRHRALTHGGAGIVVSVHQMN